MSLLDIRNLTWLGILLHKALGLSTDHRAIAMLTIIGIHGTVRRKYRLSATRVILIVTSFIGVIYWNFGTMHRLPALLSVFLVSLLQHCLNNFPSTRQSRIYPNRLLRVISLDLRENVHVSFSIDSQHLLLFKPGVTIRLFSRRRLRTIWRDFCIC